MSIKITELCINCGACEPECPNGAIYPNGDGWKLADKTNVTGSFTTMEGKVIDANAMQKPLSDEYYYIVADKCTECKGFHDEPQCASVCPVDCCVPDLDKQETEEALLNKKAKLHI